MKIKMNNVLILSSGRRVELVRFFKKAVSELNVLGKVIAADISRYAPSLYFADQFYIVPRVDAADYIDAIIKICNDERISLVVPTIDTELLLLAKEKGKIESETAAKVMVSDYKCIDTCNNKIKSAEFFCSNGFNAPKTLSRMEMESGNCQFPLFIKPKNGSSSINAYKVRNKKELDFFLGYIDEPIVQEYIEGVEYTVDVFLDFDGAIISIVPRQRLATRSGEVLKGRVDKNRTIIEDVKKMVEKLRPIGHITVQGFLDSAGKFQYIEINPRFGGGAPMSFMAGADSCKNLIKLLQGKKLQYNEDYRDGIVFSRFDDCVMIEDTND